MFLQRGAGSTEALLSDSKDQDFRRILSPSDIPNDNRPSNPRSGIIEPVFGNFSGAVSVGTTGAGCALATRIGTSAGGGDGGVGAVPVTFRCCETTTSGDSVILVAETFIPFLKPKASVSFPSIVNFCPLGIVNCWTVPSSNRRETDDGGLTQNTVPVTVSTVVTVFGVDVVMIVR